MEDNADLYRLIVALHDTSCTYEEYDLLFDEVWPTLSKWQKQRFNAARHNSNKLHDEAIDYFATKARIERGAWLEQLLEKR